MFAFSTAPLAYSRVCPCSLLGQSRYPDVAGYPELPAYLAYYAVGSLTHDDVVGKVGRRTKERGP